MTQTMIITEIKSRNRDAGFYFFEKAALRFFDSHIESRVYNGVGGVYFITSEQFHGSNDCVAPRKWTVRKFTPETGDIDTVGEFNKMDRQTAMQTARKLSKGLQEIAA